MFDDSVAKCSVIGIRANCKETTTKLINNYFIQNLTVGFAIKAQQEVF